MSEQVKATSDVVESVNGTSANGKVEKVDVSPIIHKDDFVIDALISLISFAVLTLFSFHDCRGEHV